MCKLEVDLPDQFLGYAREGTLDRLADRREVARMLIISKTLTYAQRGEPKRAIARVLLETVLNQRGSSLVVFVSFLQAEGLVENGSIPGDMLDEILDGSREQRDIGISECTIKS